MRNKLLFYIAYTAYSRIVVPYHSVMYLIISTKLIETYWMGCNACMYG